MFNFKRALCTIFWSCFLKCEFKVKAAWLKMTMFKDLMKPIHKKGIYYVPCCQCTVLIAISLMTEMNILISLVVCNLKSFFVFSFDCNLVMKMKLGWLGFTSGYSVQSCFNNKEKYLKVFSSLLQILMMALPDT